MESGLVKGLKEVADPNYSRFMAGMSLPIAIMI